MFIVESEQPESAEFELVLGKRQIASLSFLVIVLIGVFSTVAYVGGRAIERRTVLAASRSTAPQAKPEPIRAQILPAEAVVVAGNLTTVDNSAHQPSAGPADAKAPVAGTNSGGRGVVAGQMYLQIAATDRAGAEEFADRLKKKGFRAIIAPGPTPSTFRVLVGPFPDAASLAQTKADLEAAGHTSFIRRWDESEPEPAEGSPN